MVWIWMLSTIYNCVTEVTSILLCYGFYVYVDFKVETILNFFLLRIGRTTQSSNEKFQTKKIIK